MKGYGQWTQLSVFQCRLSAIRALRMDEALREVINESEDHVLILDLGPADTIKPKVRSLGKPFVPVSCEATIV
jgi:CRISPR-associated protein Cas2